MSPPVRLEDQVREVWTSNEGSMAKQTAATRWPKIVQDMIDDVWDTMAQMSPGPQQAAGSKIQKALQEIREGIEKDSALQPLKDCGIGGIEGYNEQLSKLGRCSWLACPWMFGECYLYRRVQLAFSSSPYWNKYDVFKRQKDSTFAKSRSSVEELSSRYLEVVGNSDSLKGASTEFQKLLFTEMTEIALWGNATDLSLLSHLSLDEIHSLQSRESMAKSQRNIVDNDIEEIWAYLKQPSEQDRRIDIVLDNSGFEFFTDMLYALYLLESGLASSIKFHVKDFPWFVSDVIPTDVTSLFSHLKSPEIFPNRADLDKLLLRLHKYWDLGAMSLMQHPFWTTAYSFHEMPRRAGDLLRVLKASRLVVFKGDLNYRKLTRDGLWPHTTLFREAIGPLGSSSGIALLALRTNKSDVCVGLESQSRVKALNEEAPDRAWIRNGKYAVISFSNGE